MSAPATWKDKLKKVKGVEWAVLLLMLGLAGSLLLVPGQSLFGMGGTGDTPTVTTGTADALEERIARVLSSIDGAGKVEVVIHYQKAQAVQTSWLTADASTQQDTTGDVLGVVVVAQGADDLWVRLELARAVETLLRLPADSVEVFKMGGEV